MSARDDYPYIAPYAEREAMPGALGPAGWWGTHRTQLRDLFDEVDRLRAEVAELARARRVIRHMTDAIRHADAETAPARKWEMP